MAMSQSVSPSPDEHTLLRAFPPVVGDTALTVMAMIRRRAPQLSENVSTSWGSVDFRHSEAGSVCAVFPMRDQVMLVFEHGRELNHPLLQGDSRDARWIVFRPGDALPEDDVADLIAEAIALRA